MTDLTADELSRLEHEFPDAEHDLPRAMADLRARCLAGDVRSPFGLVRSWLRRGGYHRQAGARTAISTDPIEYGQRSDPSYAAFRLGVIQRVLDGLSPHQTADLLAEHYDKFASLDGGVVGVLLDGEIAGLRAGADSWSRASGYETTPSEAF